MNQKTTDLQKTIIFDGDTIFIPYHVPSSKNSQQWTGEFLVKSKSVQKYIRKTKKIYPEGKDYFHSLIKDLPKPYYIEFTFIRETRAKFDYINSAQLVQDLMGSRYGYNWVEDDNMLVLKPYFGDYKYDKHNPGVFIRVLKQKPIHDLDRDGLNFHLRNTANFITQRDAISALLHVNEAFKLLNNGI